MIGTVFDSWNRFHADHPAKAQGVIRALVAFVSAGLAWTWFLPATAAEPAKRFLSEAPAAWEK
jgi:hypothetical protein